MLTRARIRHEEGKPALRPGRRRNKRREIGVLFLAVGRCFPRIASTHRKGVHDGTINPQRTGLWGLVASGCL